MSIIMDHMNPRPEEQLGPLLRGLSRLHILTDPPGNRDCNVNLKGYIEDISFSRGTIKAILRTDFDIDVGLTDRDLETIRTGS